MRPTEHPFAFGSGCWWSLTLAKEKERDSTMSGLYNYMASPPRHDTTSANRVREVYSRIRKATKPSCLSPFSAPLFIIVSNFLILATLIVMGRSDVVILLSQSGVYYCVLIGGTLWGWCMYSLPSCVKTLEIKEAIIKLRNQDWRPLCFIALEYPTTDRKVLYNPVFVFAVGHLMKILGYNAESDELIIKAIELEPTLASIKLSSNQSLSPTDERLLVTTLEQRMRFNATYQIWSNRKVRNTLIISAVVFITLHYAMQLVKIIYALNTH